MDHDSHLTHLSGFMLPVGRIQLGGLNDAQGIDPEICNSEFVDEFDRLLDCSWKLTDLDVLHILRDVVCICYGWSSGSTPSVTESHVLDLFTADV